MVDYLLKNSSLEIKINEMGAELASIYDSQTNKQYLWCADPAYWKRHAPILFPIVGTLKNKSYTYQEKIYSLPSHGFARDMNFSLTKQTDQEIWFSLEANEDTKNVYPFDFRLELGYRLEGRKIYVLWKVLNQGSSKMYFSIGGHPAFNCPIDSSEDQNEYYISFDTEEPIRYLHIDEQGLVNKKPTARQNVLTTDHGILPIDSHMFDYDALIIENDQAHKVALLDANKKPYLTVTFDAPLFGIWTPARKNAPFICIEPWFGRCDASDFVGTLEERQWGNVLDGGGVFEAGYQIEIG